MEARPRSCPDEQMGTSPSVLAIVFACAVFLLGAGCWRPRTGAAKTVTPILAPLDQTEIADYTVRASSEDLRLCVDRGLITFEQGGSPHAAIGDPFADDHGKLVVVNLENGELVGALSGQQESQLGRSFAAIQQSGSEVASLLVGAPGGPRGSVQRVSLPDLEVIYTIDGEDAGDWFGATLKVIGDQDRDGVDDYIVGAPRRSDSSGAVYLVSGASGIVLDRTKGPFPKSFFGQSLASLSAGGRTWVLVSAPSDSRIGAHRGSVHCYEVRSSARLDRQWELHGDADWDRLGFCMHGMQHYDGRPVFVVAAEPSRSSILIVSLNGRIVAEYYGSEGSSLGFSMGEGLDMDKDGVPDLIVGCPSVDLGPDGQDLMGGLRFLLSSGGLSGRYTFPDQIGSGVSVGSLCTEPSLMEGHVLYAVCRGESLPGTTRGVLVTFSIP